MGGRELPEGRQQAGDVGRGGGRVLLLHLLRPGQQSSPAGQVAAWRRVQTARVAPAEDNIVMIFFLRNFCLNLAAEEETEYWTELQSGMQALVQELLPLLTSRPENFRSAQGSQTRWEDKRGKNQGMQPISASVHLM